MKNKVIKIIAIIAIVALLFSLCGCGKNKDNDVLVKDVKLEESTYKLGDIMGDYTVTDIKGNTYNFSEILKEKDAIVLNFWFANCPPCKNEFPYLQKAAEAYSDDIVVIAINPVDKKIDKIEKFVSENKLTIPVAQGEDAWNDAFQIMGYPTTVIIDRYGKIGLNHIGSITEDGQFEKIFEFFTADDYEHTVINNIKDIK